MGIMEGLVVLFIGIFIGRGSMGRAFFYCGPDEEQYKNADFSILVGRKP